MTAATRKASERARRKERGEVALSGWLSASDHAVLTQMVRDSGMTQAQVVSRLIGMVGAVRGLERRNVVVVMESMTLSRWKSVTSHEGQWVRHSDIERAISL